jgi:uncharacterized repeat protein (TIGR01451 family)
MPRDRPGVLVRRLFTSFAALLSVGALSEVPSSSAAHAVYIFGATYRGTHSLGGTVEFSVLDEGGSIRGFAYTNLPIGCGTSLSSPPAREVVPIVNDSFSFSGNGNAYGGTFSGPQSATGTLTWTGPFCEGNHPTPTWVATTSAPLVADLAVTLRGSPDPAVAGANVTYTVTVENRALRGVGVSSAPGVTVATTVPAGVAVVSASSSQGACAEADGVVACALGAIASGASATATTVVTARAAGTLTVSATAASGAQDPATADNAAVETTTVQPLCVVPAVVGKELAAARREIARSHCRVGRVTRTFSRRVTKGRVLSQRPAARTRLVPDVANVDLVVSRGPKPKH